MTKERKICCVRNGTKRFATYSSDGIFLTVTCADGIRRVRLGMLQPKRTALVVFRCMLAQSDKDIVTLTPAAAVIDTVKTTAEAAPGAAHP